MKRVAVWVEGDVQGVGFRWWVKQMARQLAVTGTATNLWDGRVEVHAQGADRQVDAFVQLVVGPATGRRPGRVRSHQLSEEVVVPGEASFEAW